MNKIFRLLIFLFSFLLVGCQGWILDYGKPAAQFLEKDVLDHAEAYLGEKITVKGKVFEVNTGENAKFILDSGIECRFHRRGVHWADQIKKGDEVYVDGILKTIDKDHVLMSPVGLRDPGAPFNPMKK
ncbi:MAG: hypothetical protein H2077_08445 [Verrucomicrobiales bacterium]|nr:hypothetical protein [Verrucomicrobiales bacterium]